MEISRTFDLLERFRDINQKEDVLCCKEKGIWKKYSSQEYIDYSFNFSYGLYELGLRRGDKIVTVSANRPEWNFADMGMSMLGIVHVPAFISLNASEYQHIIRDSGAKLIIISDNKLFKSASPAFNYPGFSAMVYTFDDVKGAKNWLEIIDKGKSCADKAGN